MKNQNKEKINNFQISKVGSFGLVKDEKGKIRICAGKYCVSEKEFDTYNDANKYIESKPYELIVNLMYVTIKIHEEYENKNKSQKDTKGN